VVETPLPLQFFQLFLGEIYFYIPKTPHQAVLAIQTRNAKTVYRFNKCNANHKIVPLHSRPDVNNSPIFPILKDVLMGQWM
jgi:hypothetical protein